MTDLTLPRRRVIKAGLATGAAGMLPGGIADAQPAEVPRNRTLVLIKNGGRDGRWVDYDLWNPY
jgi:uncharacterized protein (DUF1501 family)